MEKINIISLHGFLGLPADWDQIQKHFPAATFEWWSVDYFKSSVLNAEKSFQVWAENFEQKIKLRFPEGPRVLVGYSLGGRLALQALKQNPGLFDALVLISANPGLLQEKHKFERRQNDRLWAKKFQDLPWEQLQAEWNAQPVFRDSLNEPVRLEKNYQRKQLALALTEWSLANQEDFRSLIATHNTKILWVSGEKDIKFLSLAMELKKRAPALQTEAIRKASHRVLFDDPEALAGLIKSFISAKVSAK